MKVFEVMMSSIQVCRQKHTRDARLQRTQKIYSKDLVNIYLLTYLLTYLVHGAGYFLKS
jgi:hypothetical protein